MSIEDGKNKSQSLQKQRSIVTKNEIKIKSELGPKILDLTASADEIMEWWKSQDPLHESLDKELLDMKINSRSNLRELEEKYTLDEAKFLVRASQAMVAYTKHQQMCRMYVHSAVTLLANTVFPNLIKNNDAKWADLFGSFDDVPIDAKAISIANTVLENLHTIAMRNSFSLEELRKLVMVAEMATIGFEINSTTIPQTQYLRTLKELFDKPLDIVVTYINILEKDNASNDELKEYDKIRLVAMGASVLKNTYIENSFKNNAQTGKREPLYNKVQREAYLKSLLSHFQMLIGTSSGKYNSFLDRLKESWIKGFLFENLWYLDIIMLKHMYPDKYDQVYIIPAHDYADTPGIPRVEHNRAYDFYVNYRNSENYSQNPYDLVQLKSSIQQTKNYNPKVKVNKEKNFMDIQKRRLDAKISFYMRIVERGFSNEDAPILNKYALSSAKEYLEDFVIFANK